MTAVARSCHILMLLFSAMEMVAGPSYGVSVPDEVVITLDPPRGDLGLADTIEVELTVEGPSPLRVETPSRWLTAASQRNWTITPLGPSHQEERGGGRERWVQRFRLEPYVAGPGQVVVFAPLRVNEYDYDGPVFEANVRTQVQTGDLRLRPIAPLPETETEPTLVEEGNIRLGGMGVFWAWLALFGAAVMLWQCKRRSQTYTVRQWVLAQCARLEAKWHSREGDAWAQRPTDAILAAEIAGLVREYLQRRWGWPARSWTTTEILTASAQAGWPVEHTDMLHRLLDVCDRLRFATQGLDGTDGRQLLAATRAWLEAVDPCGDTPGNATESPTSSR